MLHCQSVSVLWPQPKGLMKSLRMGIPPFTTHAVCLGIVLGWALVFHTRIGPWGTLINHLLSEMWQTRGRKPYTWHNLTWVNILIIFSPTYFVRTREVIFDASDPIMWWNMTWSHGTVAWPSPIGSVAWVKKTTLGRASKNAGKTYGKIWKHISHF